MAKKDDAKWMQRAFGNPKTKGALRKTAKKAGLITGGEAMSPGDLKQLARAQNPLTRQRANAAKNAMDVNRKRGAGRR